MVDYRRKASWSRLSAEEVRARAEIMHDEEAKKYMVRLARHYERLADDYDVIAEMKDAVA